MLFFSVISLGIFVIGAEGEIPPSNWGLIVVVDVPAGQIGQLFAPLHQ